VQKLCGRFQHKQIEIFYSGIFIASKKAGSLRISMDKDFSKKYDEPKYYAAIQ
jgi:hypothetical protein